MDKIANGQDDESWIGQLYNQFSTNLGIDGGKIDDEDIGTLGFWDWRIVGLMLGVVGFRDLRI